MTERPLRGLDQILSLVDDGMYLQRLVEEMEGNNVEMRQHAQDFGNGAKSKISITLDMKIDRFGQLDLQVDHKITGPKPPKGKGVAWLTGEGGISAHNPAQARMEIRDAGNGKRAFATSSFTEKSQPKEA
ncbi:hypothetical protein [Thioclava sp. GXIMD2076]|uniref:hypothetical protein n=1 Tax=Thioclava sp. GXIMD2076 TaxID=3131931 RepID=UPI0030D3D110